jgi:non-ribosomal peptide synthase protein (TIGR01720 family)
MEGGEEGEGEKVKRVKEKVRRVPRKGIGYGVLRYKGREEERERMREGERAEIVFNYLGQVDQVMREGGEIEAGREGGGASRGMEEEREYEVEVSSIVRGGRMRIWMVYSGERMERERMEGLMKEYEGSLRRMIEHCVSEEAGGYTPSDFPDVELSQDELDSLIAELDA